jgi:hypothetical protein
VGNIQLRGNLAQLQRQMKRLRDVAVNRSADGYPIFRHDEQWRYNAVEDDGACPTCISLHGEVFRGDYIPVDFPNYEVVSAFEVRIHGDTVFHQRESCRCTAEWLNSHEVVVQRFHSELVNAVGGA